MQELEKLDILRDRLGISYHEAKEALEASGGDLVKALIGLEEKMEEQMGGHASSWFNEIKEDMENKGESCWQNMQEQGHEWLSNLKEGILKTHCSKIKVKQGDKTLLTVPAPVGALGVIGVLASSQLAVLGALGSMVAMANNCTLKMEPSSCANQKNNSSNNHQCDQGSKGCSQGSQNNQGSQGHAMPINE